MANEKKGATPKSKKTESTDFTHADNDFNLLKIDPELAKELDEKGLAHRWINAKEYEASYGYHKTGWRAYRRPKAEGSGSLDFEYGTDPEGYVRRRDLVLAVKSKEAHGKHKAQLEEKNRVYRNIAKSQKKQLQDYARNSGVSTEITDSYDEESGYKTAE
jgi:hypothetical protein